MRSFRSRTFLAAGAFVSAVATAWSLFLSIGLGLIPCELCWYQRILMYPLPLILAVAALEERPTVYRVVLPLSTLGAAVAMYHSYLQRTTTVCDFAGDCAAVVYTVGPFSTPNLSLVAFVSVTVLVAAAAVDC